MREISDNHWIHSPSTQSKRSPVYENLLQLRIAYGRSHRKWLRDNAYSAGPEIKLHCKEEEGLGEIRQKIF